MDLSDVKRMIEPIHRRVMLIFARSTVECVDDTQSQQRLQVTALSDEVLDSVERCGAYGFTSNPLPGAAAVILFSGGNRGNGVVICTDDERYRVSGLEPGEVAIYNSTGTKVVLKNDGTIEVDATTVNVLTGDVIANGISLRHHHHSGVEPGAGITGQPVIPD